MHKTLLFISLFILIAASIPMLLFALLFMLLQVIFISLFMFLVLIMILPVMPIAGLLAVFIFSLCASSDRAESQAKRKRDCHA